MLMTIVTPGYREAAVAQRDYRQPGRGKITNADESVWKWEPAERKVIYVTPGSPLNDCNVRPRSREAAERLP